MDKEQAKKEDRAKEILKKRKAVICDCKRRKKNEKDRAKYGVCRCDAYSFSHSVGIILANALFQYVADASNAIIRDDFDLIEKHAQAIKDFAEADSWDSATVVDTDEGTAMERMFNYQRKERAFREAMFWITENWQGLWW